MKSNINIEESLPIEVLQKDFKITDEEVQSNPTLKLTVNIKSYNQIIFYRKLQVIYFRIKRSQ